MIINGFIWDEGNISHLLQAHPHVILSDLEDIVLSCTKRCIGIDSRNNKVYAAQRGKITVIFNYRRTKARIFSIRTK